MDAAVTLSPDDEAMRRIVAGDNAALAPLFDRHKVRLFGFLYHLVGDRSLAEDLLGETFLRVYRGRARYRAGTGFVPWLFAIARNLAIGEMRRRSALKRIQERFLRQAAVDPEGWSPEEDEMQEQVRQALLRLPEDQRSALVLKEYLEMDYAQVAQVLGCTEQAARARAYRARNALRGSLREWWEGRDASC
ncbi:MAG: polymerase, sigma-24 subunit, subfamily [Armatimonadetes bacterium]|jgi:RNA polymerase sigma-70 factor (ECF subfamily)|nr:polymerase, sigma-24 subunit, subfamily [Armatimonadota bacterium]